MNNHFSGGGNMVELSLRELASGIVRNDEVPDGFRTHKQWAEKERLSESTVTRLINSCVSAGKMEEQTFTVPTRAGLRKISHYRML